MMIPDSAFITIGETTRSLEEVAARRRPGAEYAVLSKGHFSKVLAMVDTPIRPDSVGGMLRFAAYAHRHSFSARSIYLGEEFPGIEYLALQAVLRRRKRIAMLIHNVVSLRRRLPLATLRLGHLLDHVLCLSDRSKQELERDYGFDSSRITVIGSRVDTDFFTPDPTAVVERQVCSAGAINRDYDTLIAAMQPLNIPTKIAADTAWRYSAGVTEQRELPSFVEMRSWGTYVKLRELYATSAIVVVPLSKSMLSGVTVALEAMAMGKPVILTRNPYVESFMTHGETGYFVPPGDPEAIRSLVRRLLDDPSEAERVGARAREAVLSRFTVAHYVDKILSVWS